MNARAQSKVLCTPTEPIPRLFRFVEAGQMATNVVCTLDQNLNLLFINKELYDQLSKAEQDRVLKTSEPYLTTARL